MSNWTTLDKNNDYEVCAETGEIRNKKTERILRGTPDYDGYIIINLKGHKYKLHKLLAEQFLPNPQNYTEVNHINTVVTDNRIANLEWSSRSHNQKNRNSNKNVTYEFIEENDLPDDMQAVEKYGDHEINNVFYSQSLDKFIYFNESRWRFMHVCFNKTKTFPYVECMDVNGKRVAIGINKFKQTLQN